VSAVGSPIEEIERARAAGLVTAKGKPVALTLEPPLAEEEIAELAAEVEAPLPRELRSLLAFTAGLDGALHEIDFAGRSLSYEQLDVFPACLPIAHDGAGNHWVLDLRPGDTEAAHVFFACHDAPVILYQSPNLAHFLHEAFRMSVPPHDSLVDDVHEDRLFNVWRTNPAELDRETALAADPELSAFAAGLDDSFVFADLRAPEVGMGFSWGRFGPRTEIRRFGFERVFAYGPPEETPRKGLLGRLFG
jgi:cell wall assembly regulator SMI1